VAGAAPEVAGHLEWGRVKTHEARTVRLPRSLAEELVAYLAGRPTGREELVFTAPRGGPLRESKFVPDRFKPAIAATNQAIAQLDPDGRPDPLPDDLRLYDLRHTAASLMIRQGASIRPCSASSATPPPASPWIPTGICSPTSWTRWPALDGPSADQGRAHPGKRWSVSGSGGAGGGARTLMPLRAQRF